MPKPEQAMWQRLQPLLKPYGHFERVENAFGSGMPDVNYCVQGHEGWIELKARERWPRLPTDPVVLAHYTPEQRRWARRRVRAGGTVWWLLRADMEHVLLPGMVAADLYDREEAPSKTKLWDSAVWLADAALDPVAIRGLAIALAGQRGI
jgi:hypothetical protein